MVTGQGNRRTELLMVGGILLLTAILRLGWPGLTEFKADEARLMRLSLQMVELEAFPLRGISSSVGLPNFPASVWIFALPLALWRHPYAPTLFTGLLNVLAVAGTWWLARRAWGPRAALAAALLYAVCPWAIVHSRKIWAQNLLPPLVLGWGLSAILAFVRRRPWFLTLHLLFLALAIQVHFAALSLLPATAFYLILFRRRLQHRPMLVGLGLALLSALPFFVYLARREGGWQQLLDLLARGGDGGFSLDAWRYTLLLSTGDQIHSLAGPEQFRAYLERVPPMALVYALWLALMVAGFVWLLRQLRRGDRSAKEIALIILVWFLMPPVFFTWFPGDVALHYLLPVYPTPFLLAGLGLRQVEGRAAPFMSLALLISAALQVYVWATLLGFVATRATPGGFGPPLALQLRAASEVRQLAAHSGAEEVLVAGQGEDTGESAFAAVYDVLLHAMPHRFVDATRSAVFPAAPSVVLLDAALAESETTLYRQASSSQREAPLRAGEGALTIVALSGQAAPAPEEALDEAAILANFVKIIGFSAVPAPDESAVRWFVHWQTADSPVPQDYHFFNHLLDAGGQRVAQADAAAFDPAQWRQGDVVVSPFTLALPAGSGAPYTMRTGMYRFPGGENVPVIDVAGNPAADAVEIQLP